MFDKKINKRDDWLKKLTDEAKAHKVWRERAKTAENAFCSYKKDDSGPLFPVFTQTVNIIHGRIYGQPPKPDVRKRHPSGSQNQAQPVQPPQVPWQAGALPPQQGQTMGGAVPMGGQQVPSPMASSGLPQPSAQLGGMQPSGQPGQQLPPNSGQMGANDPSVDDTAIAMCLERCIEFTIDTTLFDRDAHMAVNDFLVAGMGAAKVEVETEFEQVPVIDPTTGAPLLDEDGQPMQVAQIITQELHLRHFHWSQFRWEPAKDWRQVGWVSFDHYMTKDQIEEEFKVTIGDRASESYGSEDSDEPGSRLPERNKYEGVYTVHEIWNKRSRKRIWVSECYPDILDDEDDPLELDGFFPCPAPMMANVSGKELLPSPDYFQYEALCRAADELSRRINNITKQVKDIAFYDSSFGELKQANDYPDGTFIPVKDLLGKLRQTGGQASTEGVICQLDMKSKVAVLDQLIQQRDVFKSTIYEINGIADIQRGSSDASETATAQRIKNQWADIRTGQRVQVVALFFRDIFRIMSELVATKFKPEQIMAMSGINLTDNQLGTMRSDLAASYVIDVESDSTMVQNDAVEQEQLTQFMQVLTPYLEQMLPAVQSGALPADIAKEVLMSIKDTFKAGRQLEQAINQLPDTLQQLQGLTQQAQQAQQGQQQAEQQSQTLQQQLQQCQQELQDCQQQLAQGQGETEARKQSREDIKVSTDAQNKAANTQKTQAEAATEQAKALEAGAKARQALRQNAIEGHITGVQ